MPRDRFALFCSECYIVLIRGKLDAEGSHVSFMREPTDHDLLSAFNSLSTLYTSIEACKIAPFSLFLNFKKNKAHNIHLPRHPHEQPTLSKSKINTENLVHSVVWNTYFLSSGEPSDVKSPLNRLYISIN